MGNTRVVNLYKESYDTYIGGPGKGEDGYFGNPFARLLHNGEIDREECLRLYDTYFKFRIKTDPEFRRRLLALRGRILGCFCKPQSCHGDTMVEWIDNQPDPNA